MLRQLLASAVFLGSSLSASALFAGESVPAPCPKVNAEIDQQCLEKNIQKIKNEVRLLSQQAEDRRKYLEKIMDAESVPKDMKETVTKETVKNLSESSLKISDLQDLLDSETIQLAQTAKENKFAGFNWGLALAFTHLNGEKAIKEAKLIGGVVRITDNYANSTAMMFETHYYFARRNNPEINQTLGFGPFVAIRVADSENVNSDIGAYGVGLMLGGQQSGPTISSFNLGLGYFADTKINKLGGGIVEGQPLPAGETEIRYLKTDASGWMVILSAVF